MDFARPVRRVVCAHALAFVAFAMFACKSAAEKLRTTTIDTVPSGARVESRGVTLGATPLRKEYPMTFFGGPSTVFSPYLGEPLVVTLRKEGYQPKVVTLTHGPFTWTNFAGSVSFPYYTIDSSYVIHLERDRTTALREPREESTSFGTAFHCNAACFFVTNYHVVDGAERIELCRDGHCCEARVVAADTANDLALLRVPEECRRVLGVSRPLRLASSSLIDQGQQVITYGYPLPAEFAAEPHVSTGIVKSKSGLRGDPRTLTISNSIQPGNSGAPLFGSNDAVVGVVTSSLSASYLYPRYGTLPQDLNFAIRSEYVKLLFELQGIPLAHGEPQTTLPEANLATAEAREIVSRIASAVVLVRAARDSTVPRAE